MDLGSLRYRVGRCGRHDLGARRCTGLQSQKKNGLGSRDTMVTQYFKVKDQLVIIDEDHTDAVRSDLNCFNSHLLHQLRRNEMEVPERLKTRFLDPRLHTKSLVWATGCNNR